ncbi:type VI secretion system membrane subunit TssM [Biostraticola tofi]|uniref:Type VI secretion system protein ImpL n=1 Tax=Biostraticola tofi TaxID=466109 RepID=A0A4R3YZQ3_9GAMM|nr:type VI secretion system membrane subunit TssM [Biostraticola tofi]TCV98822.1 type VI secretion system protein ImpL [Biostraticola tofi]
MLKKLMVIFTSRLFWGGVMVSGACLLIWLAGPLIAIEGESPLRSAQRRRQAIAAVIGVWLVLRAMPLLYRAWLQRRLLRHLQSRSESAAGAGESDLALQMGFDNACRIIKKLASQHLQGYWKYCWRLTGRKYLYNIPWLLVIGAGGSGKSKALLHSGLDFYPPPVKRHAGTRADGHSQCEWYFSSLGILLSLPGQYMDHDNAHWPLLRSLLRRYRSRQPFDGVVLAISVQDLLFFSAEDLHRQASQMRSRLLDLARDLGRPFPVYLMLTKADCLLGFSDYFSRLDGAEMEQVWGFNLMRSGGEALHSELPIQLEAQYEKLHRRLAMALPDTLQAEADPGKRAAIFAFPQAFMSLRPPLMRQLMLIFAPHHGEEHFQLEGVYFTSANQKKISAQAPPKETGTDLFAYQPGNSELRPGDEEQKRVPAQRYFLEALFRQVILSDGTSAGNAHYRKRSQRMLCLLASGAMLLLVSMFTCAFILSYKNNCRYVNEVQDRLPYLEIHSARLAKLPNHDLRALLPLLNRLSHLADSHQFDPSAPTLAYRMGLYRGHMMHVSADVVYVHALKRLMLPLVIDRINLLAAEAASGEMPFAQEALKAYLMLHQPDRYDGRFLTHWLMARLPHQDSERPLNALEREHLRGHLLRLLDDAKPASPGGGDDQLVSQLRRVIAKKSLAKRVYCRLKMALITEHRGGYSSLAELAGPLAGQVFKRKSGQALTAPIAGLFTPEGYWLGLDRQVDNTVAAQLEEEQWVTGIKDLPDGEIVAGQIRQLYMDEFIRYWDQVLADVVLVSCRNLEERIHAIRLLSDERSPMRNLLVGLGYILRLERPQEQNQLAGWGRKLNDEAAQRISGLFRQTANDEPLWLPEDIVREHYRDLIDISRPLADAGAATRFDGIIQQLGEVYYYLVAVKAEGGHGVAHGDIMTRLRAEAGRLPQPFRAMLHSIAAETAEVSQHHAQARLRQLVNAQSGHFCRQAIQGRFPLSGARGPDILPDDLAHIFAPGCGIMSQLFQQHLRDNISQENEWRWLPASPGASTQEDSELLDAFRQAQAISGALFRADVSTPSFSFVLRPRSMDSSILSMTLDINGQITHYRHGPLTAAHLSWPGPGGAAAGQASLSLKLADGRVVARTASGPWALHRLFAGADSETLDQGPARRLLFNLEGHSARVDVTPDSSYDPFSLPEFRCLDNKGRL